MLRRDLLLATANLLGCNVLFSANGGVTLFAPEGWLFACNDSSTVTVSAVHAGKTLAITRCLEFLRQGLVKRGEVQCSNQI